MEKIINNPGLQHLAEKVFWNLVVEDLKICSKINEACKQILRKPMFWLEKFVSLSKEIERTGSKLSNKKRILTKAVQDNFRKIILENC